MKNRFLTTLRYQRAAGGLFLGLIFLACVSASAQELLKNGNFESPFPVSDPTAGWAVVFPGGFDGGPADWAIAGPSTEASAGNGGHGAHLRPNNWGTVHAYFRQVITNLTPGAGYTLNIQKMGAGFHYADDPAVARIYTCMISGSSSNAVHGYLYSNGPFSLTITCDASRQIEVQLHNFKRWMAAEVAEDMKHSKASGWWDNLSLQLTP